MNITKNEYYQSTSHEDRLYVLEQIGEENVNPITWKDRNIKKDSETWSVLALDGNEICGFHSSFLNVGMTQLTRQDFISRFTKVVTTHNSSVLKHFFN